MTTRNQQLTDKPSNYPIIPYSLCSSTFPKPQFPYHFRSQFRLNSDWLGGNISLIGTPAIEACSIIRALSQRAVLVAVLNIVTIGAPLSKGVVPADGPACSRVAAAAVGVVLCVVWWLAFGLPMQINDVTGNRMSFH
ncbi:hypothetical protein ACMFMF_004892 [Clarireedia jacksonii]